MQFYQICRVHFEPLLSLLQVSFAISCCCWFKKKKTLLEGGALQLRPINDSKPYVFQRNLAWKFTSVLPYPVTEDECGRLASPPDKRRLPVPRKRDAFRPTYAIKCGRRPPNIYRRLTDGPRTSVGCRPGRSPTTDDKKKRFPKHSGLRWNLFSPLSGSLTCERS